MNKHRTLANILIFLLFQLFAISTFSVNFVVSGKTIDKKDHSPVPFVNIAVSGTYHGTVSNASGEFVLHLPNSQKNETITFSYIGYETYELKAPHNSNAHTIKLAPLTYQVGEITVMPDSTLRTLIRMAYRKIPDNYPDFRTRSKGFYREALQRKNGEYLELTEAMLDVFKTSYRNSEQGQIKIDKSRKYIAPGIDSIMDFGFYNGHYFPHWGDMVKNNHPIIQASKNYKYELRGFTKINNRELYVIGFEPVDYEASGYIGTMYIDKATLAFERFEFRSNEERLKWRENEIFARLSSKEAKTVLIYAATEGKYYLKAVKFSEVFEVIQTGHILESVLEYVSVETDQNISSPIPFSEITPYSAVISWEATPYFESDWRDYPIVQIDENKMMSYSMSDSIFVSSLSASINEHNRNNKIERMNKIVNIFSRFDFEYNFYPQVLNVAEGMYSLHNANQSLQNVLAEQSVLASNIVWHFEGSMNYKIKKKLGIMYSASERFSNSYFLSSHKLGFSYIVPVKAYGKQVLMTFQPGYKIQNTMLSLGETDHLFRFKKGELSMKEGKSEVYWGEKSHGFDARATIKYQFRRRIWLNAFSGYYHQMGSHSSLRFEDRSGNFLTKKKKNIGLDESGLILHINNTEATKAQFDLNPLYFGFGLVFAF